MSIIRILGATVACVVAAVGIVGVWVVRPQLIASPLVYKRSAWMEAADPWWAAPTRIRMLNDVSGLLSRDHAELDQDDVVALLGEPDRINIIQGQREWLFRLGNHDTDVWWLSVCFDANGRVESWTRKSS